MRAELKSLAADFLKSAWVALNNIESKLGVLCLKKVFTLQELYASENRMEPKLSRYLANCQTSQIVPSFQVTVPGSTLTRIISTPTATVLYPMFSGQVIQNIQPHRSNVHIGSSEDSASVLVLKTKIRSVCSWICMTVVIFYNVKLFGSNEVWLIKLLI